MAFSGLYSSVRLATTTTTSGSLSPPRKILQTAWSRPLKVYGALLGLHFGLSVFVTPVVLGLAAALYFPYRALLVASKKDE
jgi:hypothetical protein